MCAWHAQTGVKLDYTSRILLYSVMLPHFGSSCKYLMRYSLHYCPRWCHMTPWYLVNIVSEKCCVIWSHLENAIRKTTLRWHHNGHDGVSNHQPCYCFLNRVLRRISTKTSNLPVTGLCAGIHRWPVNSLHKWLVTRKIFPFDDIIMIHFWP